MTRHKKSTNIRFFLLLGISFFFFVKVQSQEVKITVTTSTTTLKALIEKIEKETGYTFIFNRSVDLNQKISTNITNQNVENVLQQVFSGTNISYQIEGKQILLLAKDSKTIILPKQQNVHRISGVVSANGEPIIGARVVIKGTSTGTITDVSGRFSFDAPSNATLTVSSVGYQTQEIRVSGRTDLQVALREDDKVLDEVVVVGYGTIRKSDLTGAVSSIKTEDLPKASNTSITHMLAGQAAGLRVTQNSAQPGGGLEVLIRGAASTGAGNEPLYVIDGFPITNKSVEPESGNRYEMGSRNPLNSINPNDIESIEILKDASSTAIYGARAANGVVLITTKRGQSGTPVVTYNTNLSTQKIDKYMDMLSAKQFMQVYNEMLYQSWRMKNELSPYGNESEEDAMTDKGDYYSDGQIAAAGAGTDWLNLITRTGHIQQHNLSVSAGSQDTKYLFSFNYYGQDGVVKNSDFKRITGRINVDQNLNKYAKIGLNATYSDIFNNNVPLGNGAAENSSILNSALQFLPTVPVYDEDGNYSKNPKLGQIPNPVSLLEITDQTNTRRLLSNSYLIINPLKNLEAKLNLGIDRNSGVRNTYLPHTTLYGEQEGGKANISNSHTQDLLGEFTLKYNNQLFRNRDNMDILLGYSYQESEWNGVSAGSSVFSNDIFLWNKLQAGNVERPQVSSNKGSDILASYFGRINYSLLDKYLLTLSARYDGSTKFGANNRRAFFPSGAFAWKMQNEQFLRNVNWLSSLKLRVGFGQTGNSNIGENAYEYYEIDNEHAFVFGESVYTGSFRSQLSNPNLKWETTTELNIGFDFGFFKNRLSGSFEYFNKVIDDLLAFRKLNSLMEVAVVADNIGSTQSKGYELSIKTVNLTGKFTWDTQINMSSYDDRWKERNPDVVLQPYEKVNDPIRAIYGYVSEGILQIGEEKPAHMPDLLLGMMKIKDMDGYDPNDNSKLLGHPDGKINEADKVYLGTRDPKLIFGLGNSFGYSGFDLNIFFYGVANQNIWNPNRSRYGSTNSQYILQGSNYSTEVLQRWTTDNPSAKFPSGFTSPYPMGDTWLMENIWYVRCKNITFGYTVPERWIRKVFSNARIYADLGTPFVLTNYEGLDPEMDSMGGYPTQRTYSFGINITF